MKNDELMLKILQRSLTEYNGNLQFLDTMIPVEKQIHFFRYAERVRADRSQKTINEHIDMLNSTDATQKDRKDAMAFLSVSGDVKAYRALEKYSKEAHSEELNEWLSLSLMQAKIILECEFSDEKQIFISTGLGGKGSKLRFYAFFKSVGLKVFSDYQRDLIEKEFTYSIKQNQGSIEEIKIEDTYFYLLFLLEFQSDVKNVMLSALDECNEYGNFISKQFIITNVKIFDKEDIQNELQRNER